jgi:cellulose synthase/poly-beta-1,6-N-acetylglucosamine synthase-like glycosyltransferase
MRVSVIIPFREKNSKVLNCIESVKNQNYKNIEIITISDIVRLKIDCVKSFFNPKLKGVAEKRNFGAKIATGGILLFLDSDCIVKKNSITELIKIFKKNITDSVSGKPLAPRKGNLLGFVTGLEYEDRFDRMGEGYVDVAATTCFGILKEVFEDVGGFRDYSKTEAVGEDWDFSTRLSQKKYKIYHTNKVEVFHEHADESIKHWFKRRVQHSMYRMIHLKKYKKMTDKYSNWDMLISTTFLLSLPIVFRMYKKTKSRKLFVLPFYALLRDIAWIIGFITGLIEANKNNDI